MKKEIIKSLIIVSILFTITVSSTYAFINFQENSNNPTGKGGCFNVNYSGTEVDNLSVLSTSQYQNGIHSTITLSKGQNCKIYTEATIKLHVNSTSTIPIDNSIAASSAFKYKIKNGEVEIENGIVRRENNSYDITLTTVALTDTNKSYDIYLWIDSSLSAGEYDQKNFSGYIFAESTQSTTVKN